MASIWSWVTKTIVVFSCLRQRLDLGPHLPAQLGVEIGQRLVEQERLRIAHDGAPHRDALALAAGQFLRLAVEIGLDMQQGRGALHPRVDLGLRRAAQFQRKRHVVVDAHMRIERVVLEHHGDVALRGRHAVDALVADKEIAAVIGSRPAMIRSKVDLPQPDGPTKTTNS